MNLILIVADTFRADNLCCYSGNNARTPNLNHLAEEGVIFGNHYPEGLPTIPVRRALFTGKRTFPWVDWKTSRDIRLVVPGWRPLAETDVTLTEILRSEVYKSGFITDTYHYYAPSMNFHRAFDSWIWIRGQEADAYKIPTPGSRERYKANTAGRRYEEDYFAPRVFREAIKWLEENYCHEKIFLYVDSFDPHEPWDPPLQYLRIYEKETEPGVEDIYYHGSLIYGDTMTEAQKRHRRSLYFGEVTMVDRWIGLLLEKIRDLGLLDDSLIIFTSDHGTMLGEHEVWGKPPNSLFDPLIKLPLIMRFPKKEYSGKRIEGFTQSHDLLPTILSILGVRASEYVEKQMKGVDLLPLITEEKHEVRDHIICGYEVYTCVRDREWHYIISDQWEGPSERYWRGHKMLRGEWLFNRQEDPECYTNVSEKFQEIVHVMRKHLKCLLQEYGVTDFPMKTYLKYPTKGKEFLSIKQ